MAKPLRIAVAGLGTVGCGIVGLIGQNRELMAKRCGRPIEVVAVSARSREKDRNLDLSGFSWVDDPILLAKRSDIDVVVELIGGHSGVARQTIEAAIDAGKDVVTANKALLAIHGQELAEAAEKRGVALKFEAAVAGGIPVVKALSEGLSGNRISRVTGVMNGTCNYILTRMENEGLDYQEVFEDAQRLGFLEADPNLDVGGIDAAHKISILASIAFGVQTDFDNVEIEGIGQVTRADIEQARDMGYRIKLLCIARMSEFGIEQSTRPCLIPASSPIGQVFGVTNIVVLDGDACGPVYLIGSGAGSGPTASAVAADILDIARGNLSSTFGQLATQLTKAASTGADVPAPYYIRLCIADRPGALAKVAAALGNYEVSIDRIRQYRHEGEQAPVIIVTHTTTHQQVQKSIVTITESGVSLAEPVAFRIEKG